MCNYMINLFLNCLTQITVNVLLGKPRLSSTRSNINKLMVCHLHRLGNVVLVASTIIFVARVTCMVLITSFNSEKGED